MDKHKVGPDELYDTDLEEIKPQDIYAWFVYWYRMEPYAGEGIAAALRNDKAGRVKYMNLAHCSCHGPCDVGLKGAPEADLETFLTFDKLDDSVPSRERKRDDCDYEAWQAVVAKVKELTGSSSKS
jgi:hypothetical protein